MVNKAAWIYIRGDMEQVGKTSDDFTYVSAYFQGDQVIIVAMDVIG